MKIVYVPSDMDAPGCYRSLFPGRQLVAKGHQATMPPYTQTMTDAGRLHTHFQLELNPPDPYPDVYALQQPKERMWSEYGVAMLRRWGVASVMDVDDNYEELPSWNPAFLGSHPYRRDDKTILNRQMRRKIAKKQGFPVAMNAQNREHMNLSIRQVDALTVSTPYLAELYSRFNPNVTVIRNYLDWDIWEGIEPMCDREEDRRLRIGYLGVFDYRLGDLNVIRAVIRRFIKNHPEVDFVANTKLIDGVQTFQVHDYLGIPEEQRIGVPEYAFYPGPDGEYPLGEKTAVLDIGLVPLEMNGLNQAKSHLKGMEYNAAGIPFIASPSESYKDYWCEPGGNGFLATKEADWLECLELLVEDADLRRMMGRAARAKAKQNTIQEHVGEWESVYRKLIGDECVKLTRASIAIGAVQKVTEASAMLRVAKSIKPRVVVEIGSAAGGTFWSLGKVANSHAILVSIDMVAGSPIDVRQGKDVYQGRNRERMLTYGGPDQSVFLIDGNSQLPETRAQLEEIIGGYPIDFLFIDGDHRYAGVKADWELYRPLVRPGGVIAFHDITEQNDPRSKVHDLWAEIKAEHVTEEFIGSDNWGSGQWGGIGVVYV